MTVRCPVCRREVFASEYTGRVRPHEDTARHACPMSGKPIPIDTWQAYRLFVR